MTTTVTTHSSSVRRTRISTLTSLTSVDSGSMSPKTCTSLPSSPVSVTGMSGLLNSRNLVQDEKLVVATLATLNSGSASNLIKQDLKWIIQSRRKAEGKSELQVEFKKPVRDELTSEELVKRARRRELNRLAARRSREKGQKRKDMLVEVRIPDSSTLTDLEIRKLQSQNCELVNVLGDLTEQRNSIVLTLRQHMKQCSDYHATQNAAVGMSQRVLDLLGFSSVSVNDAQVEGVSDLYICTGDSSSSRSQSPSVVVKQEKYPYSSCPVLPLMVGISGNLIEVKHTSVPGGIVVYDESSSQTNPSVFGLSSPQASYSIPMNSPEVDSLSLPPSVPRLSPHRSFTQCSDIFSVTSSSTADDCPGEGEIIQYKHKLMKHRKQYSDITDPSSSCSRGVRVSLERSFSFPSTVRESRSNLDPSSPGSYMMELTQSDISTISLPHTPTTTSALDSGSEREGIGSPLDLAVRRASSSYSGSREKQFMASPMDTWPPAGMRAAASSRSLERRWSEDDHQTLTFPEPLNLSSKESIEEEPVLFTTDTSSSSSRRNSQYSGYTVDPYR